WLKKHAPRWHQVGRVCFHLAENKNDPDYPFAFMATYAPRLGRSGQLQFQPLSKALQEYAGARNKKLLVHLLIPVQCAAEKSTLVNDLLDSGDLFHPLAWTAKEAYSFLQEVPIFEESGLFVRLPDWWRARKRVRIAVSIGEKRKNNFGLDTMLDFNLNFALGDERLSETEFKDLLKSQDGMIYLKGQWVEVDQEKLSQALAHWKQVEEQTKHGALSFAEGMRLLAGAEIDLGSTNDRKDEIHDWSAITAGNWLKEQLAEIRATNLVNMREADKALKGKLRPYQQEGLHWLRMLVKLQLGACLADDMGLGKTIQVIALLLHLKREKKNPHKPTLLVMPASLLANWKSELANFAPSLRIVFIHPSECDRPSLEALASHPEIALAKIDVALTSYGMLQRQDWLADIPWGLLVLDEAQAIKNPGTRQCRAVKKLKSEARIALTGTPIENRLSDLWSLFDFLCPGLLGSSTVFKNFIKGLEGHEESHFAPLKNLISPYILRRLKTDKKIISDLPDKTEVKTYCGLSKIQAVVYSQAVADLRRALETSEGIKRRGLVLSFLMRFKQICNHPSQSLGDGRYAPHESGKFERLQKLCEEISARQEKVLIFTQFREIIDPLADLLHAVFGRTGLILHGGTAVKKRKPLVDAFQAENGPPFFILSLKAGGTGLNLTAASHVIHFDRWWNPAVENQATDRAFRIGQKKNVLVHKFICRGTVEEKIDALIEEKISLGKNLLKGGTETLLTALGDEALLDLVSLDLNHITMQEQKVG
ncbi:MAG: DEAD/DEAH box helicase, partial [Nitrospirae bacterium]|nr:DEAD/DEAH box helicase [Candidatus Manganitrophaceae bacterium]